MTMVQTAGLSISWTCNRRRPIASSCWPPTISVKPGVTQLSLQQRPIWLRREPQFSNQRERGMAKPFYVPAILTATLAMLGWAGHFTIVGMDLIQVSAASRRAACGETALPRRRLTPARPTRPTTCLEPMLSPAALRGSCLRLRLCCGSSFCRPRGKSSTRRCRDNGCKEWKLLL
jgi:hypothetical protein